MTDAELAALFCLLFIAAATTAIYFAVQCLMLRDKLREEQLRAKADGAELAIIRERKMLTFYVTTWGKN